MSDDVTDDVTADERGDPWLIGLLTRSDVWEDPPPGLPELVVATIRREAPDAADADDGPGPPAELARYRRSTAFPWWLTAAAAVTVVVGVVGVVRWLDTDREPSDAAVVTLSATEAAPGASAEATVRATPAGLVIVLDTDGLPGAPPDAFYEAWVSDGERRVSAGTFHLRGGSGPIELWAGVDDPAYTSLTITLEPNDGDAASSGDVRLAGTFSLADGG